MKWWAWLLIIAASIGFGLWAGNMFWAVGAGAGVLGLLAKAWRDSADRGPEWADDQRRKVDAEDQRRREDDRAARAAAASAAAASRAGAVPMAPPKSKHLDVSDWP